MKKIHTKIMREWKYCEFCNFNSKKENEMTKLVTEFIFTRRNIITEETIQQTKAEMSKMRENGYILHSEALKEFQEEHRRYPNRRTNLHKNF